jgi:hypothetical protein
VRAHTGHPLPGGSRCLCAVGAGGFPHLHQGGCLLCSGVDYGPDWLNQKHNCVSAFFPPLGSSPTPWHVSPLRTSLRAVSCDTYLESEHWAVACVWRAGSEEPPPSCTAGAVESGAGAHSWKPESRILDWALSAARLRLQGLGLSGGWLENEVLGQGQR